MYVSGVAGYTLNALWFYKMVGGILAVVKGSKRE